MPSKKKQNEKEVDISTFLIHIPLDSITEDLSQLGGLKYVKHRVFLFTKFIAQALENPDLAILKQGRVMLKGPPGTGKSMMAKIMAKLVGCDLYIVSISQMVSSYLGKTQKNFASVIAYIKSIAKPSDKGVIFFLDEFDAFARSRTMTNDSQEMQRLVNAILQEFDQISLLDKVFILAATNHESLLDKAVWRRFDEVWDFPLPSKSEIREICYTLIRNNENKIGVAFSVDPEKILDDLEGFSGADIERLIKDAVFRSIYDEDYKVTTEKLQEILKEGAIRSTQSLIVESGRPSKGNGYSGDHSGGSTVIVNSFSPATREEYQGPLMAAIRNPEIYTLLETACNTIKDIPLSTRQLIVSLTNGGLFLEEDPAKLLQQLSTVL